MNPCGGEDYEQTWGQIDDSSLLGVPTRDEVAPEILTWLHFISGTGRRRPYRK